MTVFSFTAPRVTEEDERIERELLSEEERQQLHDDVYGPTEIVETQEQLETAHVRFERALSEIKDADKKEYLEALRLVPEIVEKECPPLMFLRCEDHDEKAAVKRLLQYWKLRLRFFGCEKAFLPMTTTGAMKDDIPYLLYGYISSLPNDQNGRVVVFWDRIRMCEPFVTRDQAYRIAFYMSQKIAINESAQKHGGVILMNYEGFDIYRHMDRIRTKMFARFLTGCMPIRIRSFHIFCGRSSAVLELALPVLKSLYGRHLRLRMVLHGGNGQNQDYEFSTQKYGIVAKNLDACALGVGFSLDIFIEWINKQDRDDSDASSDDTSITSQTVS